MRKRTIIIILAILIFIPVTGNSSDAPQIKSFEDCVPLVSYVTNQKDALSKADLQYFLSTFSNNHCINNVEFSEYGNEVLFSLMESNPNLFFEALFSLGQGQIETIKVQINNPVDDSINVVKIYKAIESSNMHKDLKMKALNFLKEAYEKEQKSVHVETP